MGSRSALGSYTGEVAAAAKVAIDVEARRRADGLVRSQGVSHLDYR